MASLDEQFVQSLEAAVDVVSLLAGVVALDDEVRRLGGVVAGLLNGGVEGCGEQWQQLVEG